VGLLTSYSKRADLLYDLQEALRQLQRASEDDSPPSVRSVRSPDRKSQVWALADRVSQTQVREIVSAFEDGTPRWKIAERYQISVSSVGRLLRAHRESGTLGTDSEPSDYGV
jgi:hypothetical protein